MDLTANDKLLIFDFMEWGSLNNDFSKKENLKFENWKKFSSIKKMLEYTGSKNLEEAGFKYPIIINEENHILIKIK